MEGVLDAQFYEHDRKITQILEERLVSKYERNEIGELEKVERNLLFRRPVDTRDSGHRFLHFIIDLYIVPGVLSFFVLTFQSLIPSPALIFLICFNYFGVFIVLEHLFQKTIGKVLTRSVVIDEYARRPHFLKIVLRTVIRFIPFEPLSMKDGRCWHDRWTDTYVISEKEWTQLKLLLQDEANFREVAGNR
jgi:hypothetical protein